MSAYFPENALQNRDAVLNGIAYDITTQRVLITGKWWSHVIEIQHPFTKYTFFQKIQNFFSNIFSEKEYKKRKSK